MAILKELWSWITTGRRSLENPNLSLQDAGAWEDAGLMSAASSGARVSRETALTLAAVWRATNLIASSVGKLPLYVYQRQGRNKERATKHPAYGLLRWNPMPEMTGRTFRKTLTAHAVLQGAGYAYIVRDGAAKPLELWPLLPHETYPLRVNGRLWYVTHVAGQARKLPPEDVLHIQGLSYDGFTPYSVLDRARDSLGLGIAAHKYSAKYFANGAEPRVVIQVPAGVNWDAKKQQEFLRQWNDMHQGLEHSHRTAILTGGASVNAFSVRAKDAQLLESRKFEYTEIANWFGLPPHKVGDSTRASYNSLEQENQAFLDDCLEDWLIAWEEECRNKLLREREKDADSHTVAFLRQAMVRADLAARYASYATAIERRIMNPNEVRALEDMNPYEGGDEFLAPLNLAQPGAKPPPGDPPQKMPADPPKDMPMDPPKDMPQDMPKKKGAAAIAAAHRGLVIDAARRAVRRLATHAKRAAEKPAGFVAWLDALEADHGPTLREMFSPVVAAWRALSPSAAEAAPDRPEDFDPAAEILRETRQSLLAVSGQATASRLSSAIAAATTVLETELPQKVADRLCL